MLTNLKLFSDFLTNKDIKALALASNEPETNQTILEKCPEVKLEMLSNRSSPNEYGLKLYPDIYYTEGYVRDGIDVEGNNALMVEYDLATKIANKKVRNYKNKNVEENLDFPSNKKFQATIDCEKYENFYKSLIELYKPVNIKTKKEFDSKHESLSSFFTPLEI